MSHTSDVTSVCLLCVQAVADTVQARHPLHTLCGLAVLVIDPQIVLNPAQPVMRQQPAAVRLIVPESLVPQLSAGRHELSDADSPSNSYMFGEASEIFELDFVGLVTTDSGFVSLIARGALPPSTPC